jgi:hypothetical protein
MSKEKCPHCNGDRERCWIDYPEDDNCIHVAIAKNGAMSLVQVAERLNLSFVRVSQIESKIKKKLSTNSELLKLLGN